MEHPRTRICLIDGDEEARRAVQAALAPLDVHLSCYANGREGLAALKAESFELIILDLLLDELSGFELLEGLDPKVPIVIISSLVIDDEIVAGERLRSNATLPKPLDPNDLRSRICALLGIGPQPEDEPQRQRVLVVEDNEYNAELVRLRLEHDNFAVAHAADGNSALQLHQSYAPDIVLLDIQIPKPDGIAVLRAIRDRDPDVLVIMMTAFGSEKIAVQAMQIGADEYLTKPLEHRTLARFIDKAWQRSQLRVRNRQLSERLWHSNRLLLAQYRATAEALRALEQKQEELIRAQRLAAVTEAAVSINHEINNPLCSIMGNADLLLRKYPDAGEDMLRKLRSIERESSRIKDITKKLANLANVVTTRYAGGVDMIDINRSFDATTPGPQRPDEG